MVDHGASLDYDLSAISARLGEIQDRLADLTPLMERIGASLLTSSQQRFESKTGPDGDKWPALAASTIAARRRAKASPNDILVFRGAMRLSLNYRTGRDNVVISMGGTGNSVAYSRLHQLGGRAGRGHKVKIQARPVLGLSRDDEAAIAKIVDQYVLGA